MATLTIGEYRPDVSDLNGASTSLVLNVLPRSDGYGPMRGLSVFTDELAAQGRGVFFARNTDGSVLIFVGTQSRLYVLNNTTLKWKDVSKGGTDYPSLSADANWTFAQFNSVVVACQENTPPQAYTIGSSTAFGDLGGSPPQAAYVTVVNRFLVLSGLLSFPRRVQWSGLNAITTWTSGVTYSDYQDLPDGGNTKGVVGGELGIIVQSSSLRRMTFSPGADIIFQIDRIARDIGTAMPYSLVDANGTIAFYSTKGFVLVDGAGGIKPIGKERVDRTFLGVVDPANPQLVIGASKPGSNLIFWAYRTLLYNGAGFDKILAYDTVLDRWSPIDFEGQYLGSVARPGLTLENLDTIGSTDVVGAADNGSGLIRIEVGDTTGWTTGDIKTVASVEGTTEANGTWTITVVDGTHIDLQGSTFANTYTGSGYVAGSIDDMTVSLDEFSTATVDELGAIDSNGALGFFSGDTLEATVETAEQSAVDKRLFVRGYYPVTDAATVYASTGKRENMSATPVYSSEAVVNGSGFCPQRASARLARARLRFPASHVWTFVTGVVPDFGGEGRR